jgi:dTDP-4-dehydrorhamnose reductase
MKAFVTGANGLLGRTFCSLDSELVPIVRKDFDLFKGRHEDFKDFIRKYIVEHDFKRPDILIHCAAMIGRKCEEQKEIAFQTNVFGTRAIAGVCREFDIKVFYISTDYVFDGTKGPYNEMDFVNPCPNGYYAFTKYCGEREAMMFGGIVIRTSFCDMTWPYEGAYVDKWSSRDTVDVIAPLILKVISAMWRTGGGPDIVHVGTERKTFFDLAKKIKPDVKPISIKDVPFYVPSDTSFDLDDMNLWLKEGKRKDGECT